MSAREAGDAAALGEGGTRWAAAASAGESGAPAPRARRGSCPRASRDALSSAAPWRREAWHQRKRERPPLTKKNPERTPTAAVNAAWQWNPHATVTTVVPPPLSESASGSEIENGASEFTCGSNETRT